MYPRPPPVQSRLLGLQALRAVGALLVVYAHSIDTAEVAVGGPKQAKFFYWENFGASGLDIFFVISGFIVCLVAVRGASEGAGARLASAGDFIKRRITRIFPLYWMLTTFLLARLASVRGLHIVRVWWLPTLFLLPSFTYPAHFPLLGLGWSLLFELYFYCVLTAFLLFTPRFVVRNAVLFLGAMVAMGWFMGFRHPLVVVWMNPLVLEFIFGGLVYLLFLRVRRGGVAAGWLGLPMLWMGGLLLSVTVFTGYGVASEAPAMLAGDNCWLRVGVWGVPAALLVCGVVFWDPPMRSMPGRGLIFLGNASYSIYLCTVPSLYVSERIWHLFHGLRADAAVLLGVFACVATGVVCYLLFERPMMRFFHNWYKPVFS